MNVSEIEEIIETLVRLQRQHGHVVEIPGLLLDLIAQRTVTGENEAEISDITANPRDFGEAVDALLAAHIAGIKRHDGFIGQP